MSFLGEVGKGRGRMARKERSIMAWIRGMDRGKRKEIVADLQER